MVLLIGSFILIILIDIRDLLRVKNLIIIIVYVSILITAFSLGLLQMRDSLNCNPSEIIETIVRGFIK